MEYREFLTWVDDLWPFMVRATLEKTEPETWSVVITVLEDFKAPWGQDPYVTTVTRDQYLDYGDLREWSDSFITSMVTKASLQFICWVRSETSYRVTVTRHEDVIAATFVVASAVHPVVWGNEPEIREVAARVVDRFAGGIEEWAVVEATMEHDYFLAESRFTAHPETVCAVQDRPGANEMAAE